MSEPNLYYMTSKTCAPCKALLPKATRLAEEHNVNMQVIDIDDRPDIATQAGVLSVPTIIVAKSIASITQGSPRLLPAQARASNVRTLTENVQDGLYG